MSRPLALSLAVGLALTGWSAAADPTPGLTDELTVRAAGLHTDGPALLEFFRRRTRARAEPKQIETLIRQLGDSSPEVREKVAGELVALGTVAVPWLRQAAYDPDDEAVATRARHCLQWIEGAVPRGGPRVPNQPVVYSASRAGGTIYSGAAPAAAMAVPSLPSAAARLLVLRRPEGAAGVLLDYLPEADNETVLDEVKTALGALALTDGKPDAALVRGLEDPVALRRVVAAEVLCQAAATDVLPALHRLLRDPKAMVRLRVALALADRKEPEAVPVLIALLAELPGGEAQAAEDYLLNLASEQAPQVSLGTDAASRSKCRDAWAAWWSGKEGAALLAELRQRAVSDADRDRARLLIRQLGDDSFAVREKAMTELQALGAGAVPLLRQASTSPDVEVARRAQKCLELVEKEKQAPLSAVTIRLLAYLRPPGVAEALLNYLPLADDESLAAEARAALAAVAVRDGRPDPALVRALKDELPLRRSAAADALCRAGLREPLPALHQLLHDPDRGVRLHAALALAGAGDREAVPVVIAALAEVPLEAGLEAEDYLTRLAGDRVPEGHPGSDPAARARARTAWEEWWREQGPAVSSLQMQSARLPIRQQLGYTLLVFGDNGQVEELGRDGKPRWQLSGLQGPCDAQALPNGRVLVAESQGGRVSERNLKGEVVWEKRVNWPIGCQRLPNGDTFIVMRNQLLEVDRDGKEVFTYARPMHDITAAQKLRDGHILLATGSGQVVRLDAAGKEVKSFRLTNQVQPGGLEALPNGRVLIAQPWTNKVAEYDGDGKVVWEANVQQPMTASRLPNGHLLVATQHWPSQVLELDRGGKTVWQHQAASRVTRAKRR